MLVTSQVLLLSSETNRANSPSGFFPTVHAAKLKRSTPRRPDSGEQKQQSGTIRPAAVCAIACSHHHHHPQPSPAQSASRISKVSLSLSVLLLFGHSQHTRTPYTALGLLTAPSFVNETAQALFLHSVGVLKSHTNVARTRPHTRYQKAPPTARALTAFDPPLPSALGRRFNNFHPPDIWDSRRGLWLDWPRWETGSHSALPFPPAPFVLLKVSYA